MTDPEPLSEVLFRWLARRLVPYTPPRRPRRPALSLVREDGSMLVYKLVLPPPGAPDVARRVLTAIVGDGEPTSEDVADGQEVRFNRGDQVILTLVDVDADGNASHPSDPYSFTAHDEIAPPQPGTIGVTEVREE
jgi:hypothetical protein